MEVSEAKASCSEPSLYAFKLSLIQLEGRISDHVVRTFPRQLFARNAVYAPLCRASMHV